MASTITKPQVLAMPFCNSGNKNTIPVNPTGNQYASLTEGFPELTELPLPNGKPPERRDFNGIGNLLSQFYFAFQNGWWPTFDADVSTAIGGYALGAILWYDTGGYFVKSLKANNTDNFVSDPTKIDGVSWQRQTAGLATTDLANVSTTLATLDSVMPAGMDYVVESQLPNSLNNYTWYRKYRSGWIEQGIHKENGYGTFTFPKPMADTNYSVAMSYRQSSSSDAYEVIWSACSYRNKQTTSVEYGSSIDNKRFEAFDIIIAGQGATL